MNSKWDKYIVEKAPESKWDKYIVEKAPQGDSWLSLIGKSALKGVSSLADIPKLAATAAEGVVNLGRKTKGSPIEQYWAGINNPEEFAKSKIKIDKTAPQTNYSDYIPSTEDIRESVKKHTNIDLEPKPTSPAQRIVSHGVDFGTSMTPVGLTGKGSNLFNKFKNAANMTKGATVVGLGSGALQESGMNPLTADLTSSVLTPSVGSVAKSTANTLKTAHLKLPMYMMGLTPSRIDVEAAKAAKKLGVELPAAVLTDSTLTGLADQTIAKTPILGNVLKDKYDKAQEQIYKNLKDIYSDVGPVKTPEIEKKIFDLYEKRKAELPSDAVIKPLHASEALNKIKINSALMSPEEKQLANELNTLKNELSPSLNSKFGAVNLPLSDYSVDRLIGTKQSLNSIIKWDIPEGVRNQLRSIQKGISKDIEEYGKTNPEWYKSYKDADDLFARVSKREKVETLLRNQGLNEPEDLSYAMISRSINDKKKNKLLAKHTSEKNFEKIKNLGIVTNALVKKARRNPNPSGTAPTIATLAYLTSLFTAPAATLSGTGAFGLAGMGGATKLMTDQKFLDLALKFAEEKGKSQLNSSMELNKRAKEITGYTLNSLYKAAQRETNNKVD